MVKEERWYPPCLNETDNGTEFTAPWNSLEKTLFTKIIECSLTSTHKTIPAGAKTYQSDVESSYRLIEDEFYACRYFSSALIFYFCCITFENFFNHSCSGNKAFIGLGRLYKYAD